MSQSQPRTPKAEQEPVKYGDILPVSSELASKPVAPRDAAAVQAAETEALGQVQKGGPAAVMQSAAHVNVRRGVLGRDDATEAASQHGVSVSEPDVGDKLDVTEVVGKEVVGKYVAVGKVEPPQSALSPTAVTIGQALESVVNSAGDKAVDESDAAVIQAVESRATGRNEVIRGGVASEAESVAKLNARTLAEEKKIKLRDVLAGATSKLPDRAVTKEDADVAVAAELRNKLEMSTYPGGVAESMVAAARHNQK